MEYTYIREIDNIIEDKSKLKELLLYLLQTNCDRYNDYDAEKLYETFCDVPYKCFLDIIHNMHCYEYRVECFYRYLDNFHKMTRIDINDKVCFLLNNNYKIIYNIDERIKFEEYLLRSSFRNFEFLQALIEYYKTQLKLNELEVIIQESDVFKPDDNTEHLHFILNLKYICDYVTDFTTNKFVAFCKRMIKKYYKIKGFDNKKITRYNNIYAKYIDNKLE